MDMATKHKIKTLVIAGSVFALIMGYFFGDIKSRYEYKQYCDNEGGLHVHVPLKKNVGWLAENFNDAKAAARLDNIGFVRYSEPQKDPNTYDLRYLGDNPQRDDSFEKVIADLSKDVAYVWRRTTGPVAENRKIIKYSYEISDSKTNKLLVSFYSFQYSDYDPKSKSFNSPTGESCFHSLARNIIEKSSWMEAINTAFSDG